MRFGVLSALVLGIVRSAWMCDDAYITLRTVDNLVHGYGLRWNVAERVQTFTHPLWLIALSVPYAVTREAYLTPLAVSLTLSLAAVWIALRRARAWETVLVGGSVLVFSKAFVEYSTSGLENPLVFLLLAAYARREEGAIDDDDTTTLWALGALVMLCRLDLGLIVLPSLVWCSWKRPYGAQVRSAIIGLSPLILWELFSVAYYGFLFPNTAYAKLQTGIRTADLVRQGLLYLRDSFNRDPITLAALAAFVARSVTVRPRENAWLAIGIGAYLTYVIMIGGDFMTGRFLSAPLFLSTCLFVRTEGGAGPAAAVAACVLVAMLGLLATTRPPILTNGHTFDDEPRDVYGIGGVDDERAFYSRYTGLLRYTRAVPLPWNGDVQEARVLRGNPQVVVTQGIGLFGFFVGPAVYIVDPMALGDPLLARLRPRLAANWRIGHFERTIPDGYLRALETGRNMISDPTVARFYDDIVLITRGPIWS
jgi:arabinofuranosyltransferase